MIQEIFSVPIYKIQLELDVSKMKLFCDKYQHENTGRVVSNRGGYQSKDLSLADVTLQPLIEAIKTHSTQFAKTFAFVTMQKELVQVFAQWQKNKNRKMLDILYNNNKKQTMNSIWFNTNSYNDTNVYHNHGEGGFNISGVFYIKTPEGCGDIGFKHPAQDSLNYHFIDVKPSENVRTFNKKTWCLPSVVNMLYLFPSWLYHSVKSNRNKVEKRISMSFNI